MAAARARAHTWPRRCLGIEWFHLTLSSNSSKDKVVLFFNIWFEGWNEWDNISVNTITKPHVLQNKSFFSFILLCSPSAHPTRFALLCWHRHTPALSFALCKLVPPPATWTVLAHGSTHLPLCWFHWSAPSYLKQCRIRPQECWIRPSTTVCGGSVCPRLLAPSLVPLDMPALSYVCSLHILAMCVRTSLITKKNEFS